MHDDERNAIAALQAGNIAGLHYIVEHYQLPALRLAYNLCNDRAMAEDAVADSFIAVIEHAASYDPSRPFQSWFYRIVVNRVRTLRRREDRVRTYPDARDLLQERPAPGPGPEVEVVHREVEQALLSYLDRLPEPQREVVILRYYLDLDERTIAKVLGTAVGTVKWRLHQARKRLRQQLEAGSQMRARLVEEVPDA